MDTKDKHICSLYYSRRQFNSMNESISQCENQTKVKLLIDCAGYVGNHKASGLDPSPRLKRFRYEIVRDLENILAYYIIQHLSVAWLADTLAAASSKQSK